MGIWGTALYDGDIALDIRDEYMFQLLDGHTPTEAANLTARALQIEETSGEDYIFWLIIADTQWKLGHLDSETRSRAMEVISSGMDEAFWVNSSTKIKKERHKVIENLCKKINSPQPPQKKLQKPKGKKCSYQIGDVLSVHMVKLDLSANYQHLAPYQGKYALVHVIGYGEVPTSSNLHAPQNQHAIVLAYNWMGNKCGSLEIAQQCGVLDITKGTKDNPEFIFKLVYDWGRKEYEITKIGNIQPKPGILNMGRYYSSPVSWAIISWSIACGYHEVTFGDAS